MMTQTWKNLKPQTSRVPPFLCGDELTKGPVLENRKIEKFAPCGTRGSGLGFRFGVQVWGEEDIQEQLAVRDPKLEKKREE